MAKAKVIINALAWVYMSLAVGWTVLLVAAMGFLWRHRRLPHLQMRRLPLVFTALILLHMFGATTLTANVFGPLLPCGVEYWIMSMLLPCGIAVFQVANTQFLYIASQQRKYNSAQTLDELVRGSVKKVSVLDGQSGTFRERTVRRLRACDQLTRMVIFIGAGMAIQAALSLLIYLLSRKFHPGFGVLPANLLGTDSEVRGRCSRGWEWWLSIVWQFFWAWIYAPYILWRSRDIQDTHGWRIQTILCCITGLPCSPLWLCGLYLSQFAPLNHVFIPPSWFSLSIFLIQCFTLLIPCYQVFKHHNLKNETLAAIADWEAKNKAYGSVDTDSTKVDSGSVTDFPSCGDSEKGIVQAHHRKSSTEGSVTSRKSHLYTMTALEHALKWNASPLQKFAALKDFSGENISFLTHLQGWRKACAKKTHDKYSCKLPSEREAENNSDQRLRAQFNRAVKLYAAFVSTEHAEFPINISSKVLKALDDIFARPAQLLFGDTRSESSYNSATPFDDFGKDNARSNVEQVMPRSSKDIFELDDLWYHGEIPSAFNLNVFDDSESEIKYLVLTNTWPKFVKAGYVEQVHEDDGNGFGRRLSRFFRMRGRNSL